MAGTLLINPAFADVERVVNGGFETGNLTGWTIQEPPLWEGGVTSAQHNSGTYSLFLAQVDAIYQAFSPAISTTSDLRLWAKATGDETYPLVVSIYYSDGTGTAQGIKPPGYWTQYTFPVDHTKLVNKIGFMTWEMAFPGYYVDDVSLIGPSPVLATAHVFIEHTYRGDLIVDIGVGNPRAPYWTERIWNGEGGSLDDLDLTVDLSDAVAYLPPSSIDRWFLKVYDRSLGDIGQIVKFSIKYKRNTYYSTDVPVPIGDYQTSFAFIPSVTPPPKVTSFTILPNPFSPNGDGVKDTATIKASFNVVVNWTLQVRTLAGIVVRNWTGVGNSLSVVWNGKNSAGVTVPRGTYTIKIWVVDKAGNKASPHPITKTVTVL